VPKLIAGLVSFATGLALIIAVGIFMCGSQRRRFAQFSRRKGQIVAMLDAKREEMAKQRSDCRELEKTKSPSKRRKQRVSRTSKSQSKSRLMSPPPFATRRTQRNGDHGQESDDDTGVGTQAGRSRVTPATATLAGFAVQTGPGVQAWPSEQLGLYSGSHGERGFKPSESGSTETSSLRHGQSRGHSESPLMRKGSSRRHRLRESSTGSSSRRSYDEVSSVIRKKRVPQVR
jgi:hypothetical protein